MKILFSICVLLAGFYNCHSADVLDIEYVRRQYGKAVSDKELCKTMITELSRNTESPVCLAYLGAYQMIWANHTFSPVDKLNTFNTGKKNIEKAVKQSANNVEIRFVRLSVQKNCPGFLGYNENIVQDEQYLSDYKNTIRSETLFNMVNKLLNE